MIVLGFDTATAATAVGVLEDRPGAEGRAGQDAPERASAHATERRHDPVAGERPGHGPQLLVLAQELLEAHGLAFADVGRIGVGLGPGGFTGLRIGVATARALAQGSGAELVGVSTLEALASAAEPATAGQGVLAVVDARRGEVFLAGWRDGEQVLGPLAIAPAQVAAIPEIAGAAWLAVGDGAVRFRDDLEGAGCAVPADGSAQHGVSALAVCRLARHARHATQRDLVIPDYLRKPDAVRSKP